MVLTSTHSSNSLLNTFHAYQLLYQARIDMGKVTSEVLDFPPLRCRTPLTPPAFFSSQAKGFSFLALCFSVGLFVGPILGGELLGAANWAPWAPWGWDGFFWLIGF